jgi:hypothetical protein
MTVVNPPPPPNPQQFLQLVTPQTLQLAYGTGTCTWTASATGSATLTVTHGLTRIPAAVLCSYNGNAGGGLTFSCYFAVQTKTATQFTVIAITAGAAQPINAFAGFDWIAVG